jgi:WD40 repeat protein
MILPFQEAIENSALQIYSSALPFAPSTSRISQHYQEIFRDLGPQVLSGRWSLQSQSISLVGHKSRVECIAFSPDGRRIASGSLDTTIRLWDGETGAAVSEPLKGHTGRILCLAFSPDGRRIASGSEDNTIRLWDAYTGGMAGKLIQVQEYPASLALYTQNHDLFVVFNDHKVYNVSMSPPSLGYINSPLPASVADSRIQYDRPWTLIHSRLQVRFCIPSNFRRPVHKIYQGKIAYGADDGSIIVVDCTHLL